eukprot:PhF_6_TR15112/c0_g1_i2/m.23801
MDNTNCKRIRHLAGHSDSQDGGCQEGGGSYRSPNLINIDVELHFSDIRGSSSSSQSSDCVVHTLHDVPIPSPQGAPPSTDDVVHVIQSTCLPTFFQFYGFCVTNAELHPSEPKARLQLGSHPNENTSKKSKIGCRTHGPFACTCAFLFETFNSFTKALSEISFAVGVGTGDSIPPFLHVEKGSPADVAPNLLVTCLELNHETKCNFRRIVRGGYHGTPPPPDIISCATLLQCIEDTPSVVFINMHRRYIAFIVSDPNVPLSSLQRVYVVSLTSADVSRDNDSLVRAMTSSNAPSASFPGVWCCAVCKVSHIGTDNQDTCGECRKAVCRQTDKSPPSCSGRCARCGKLVCPQCLLMCHLDNGRGQQLCVTCSAEDVSASY